MKKAIIIDGNALLYRSFYATYKQLDFYKQNNLIPTNALKLMMMIFFKILSLENYSYAVIAYDHKDKNFRDDSFEDYKKNRKKTPDELINQIPLIHEVSKLFGFNYQCVSGIEADDVVASTAKLFSKNNIKSDIYSSDKDILQLVEKNIDVILFKKGISDTIINNLDNFENLNDGLKPCQITDFKGLAGDSSDNFIGVKGIGKKTAIDLIKKYGSIEEIYKNIDNIKSEKIQEKLLNDKENAFKFKKLATLKIDFYDNLSVDEFLIKKIDLNAIKEIVKKYKINGFDKYWIL